MTETIWETVELFCPVCNATFHQLVVLHKLPKGFKIDKYLAGMVENHDHAAYRAAQSQEKPGRTERNRPSLLKAARRKRGDTR